MTSTRAQKPKDPWIFRLQRLMPHRVREILLVSSKYDAFILEEDGPLTERLFSEYSELSLPWYPRIIHARTGREAEELLRERRIDLVLTTSRIGDTDVDTVARRLKEIDPEVPIVLLTFSEADLRALPGGIENSPIDHVFLWSGDARIMLAIHKLVEDAYNAEHDARLTGVPIIIMVEDSIRHYSTCLTLLYLELVQQAQSLIAEGVNNLHKLLRLRTRPKVLLAKDYESAMALWERYGEYVFAIVSDVSFPRGGKEDPDAGVALVEAIRARTPDMPVLLQSAGRENAQRAEQLKCFFVDKNSSTLSRELHKFVSDSLGFGEFVFRLPDHSEVARARDTYEMERVLQSVDARSVTYHAERNHFSTWLRARGMFNLADMLRAHSVAEFEGDAEKGREFLVSVVRRALLQEQEGMVTDYSTRQTKPDSRVIRLGTGSIGGKARGVAFAASVLARHAAVDAFPDLEVLVPRTVIIGTEEYDRFLDLNGLAEKIGEAQNPQEILRLFLNGRLPEDLLHDLRAVSDQLAGPLAVRSSSLLEDLQFQPFSGIYATYMLPNSHPDREERFRELCRAIKAVYASTFNDDARAYVENTPFMPEEEKMAVVIQAVVGQRHGDRFYPHMSGVALSHNYYPVKGQTSEGGVALLAVGLGHIVVHGGKTLRFSPRSPGILPQFASVQDLLDHSQTQFYALDMSRPIIDFEAGDESSLSLYDLRAAEQDGTLALAGSVYSAEDDAVRDNLKLPGRRVVTFNNVLKWNAVPLAPTLDKLLSIMRTAMGCAVEIEFAVDVGDWGRSVPGDRPRRDPRLYVLQIRPMVTSFLEQQLDPVHHEPESILCRTHQALGHGIYRDLRDAVYVKAGAFEREESPDIARQVGELDHLLRGERRPYLLVGPGRWGTSDPRLGVPVQWTQIAGARIITETALQGIAVEPSQGTHFFQNITSLGIGYLTVSEIEPCADHDFCDLAWLDGLPAAHETSAVRHVRFESPLVAYLNGQENTATVLKPGVEDEPE